MRIRGLNVFDRGGFTPSSAGSLQCQNKERSINARMRMHALSNDAMMVIKSASPKTDRKATAKVSIVAC